MERGRKGCMERVNGEERFIYKRVRGRKGGKKEMFRRTLEERGKERVEGGEREKKGVSGTGRRGIGSSGRRKRREEGREREN